MSNTDAEILAGIEKAVEAGTMTVFTPRAVKVIKVRFTEDQIFDGSIPRECYENATTETFECDDVEDAIRVLRGTGVTFGATGTVWAADPDGSYVSDYTTGERTEVSAHLEGFSDDETAAIMAVIG